MKDYAKKGILAGMVLENMSEDYVLAIQEQQEETKTSRINNKFFNKNKKKKKHLEEEYDN